MKVLICNSQDDIKIEDRKVPDIGSNEVLIKTIFCGLCGSDIVKIINPEVKKPVKLGHEVIGLAEKVGLDVKKIKKGDIVVVSHHIPCYNCVYCFHKNYSMCRHFKETNLDPQGFSEYVKLSGEHIKYNTFIIDDKRNIRNLIFTEPTACCLRAVERIDFRVGDKVMVVGCGTIGIIFISLFKLLYDAKVAVVDIDDKKLKFAKNFGADMVINSRKEDVKEKILSFTGFGVDVVELTVTIPETVNQSISCVRDGGYIQVFAGPSGKSDILVDFESLYKREITIFSSYSTAPEQLKRSFNYLKSGKLNFTPLISSILPINKFKEGLDLALSKKSFKILYYFNKNLIEGI